MRSAEVRRRFLAHFEANGHSVVPSAPLPFDDPNLLFVNAGMVQFKPYFLGQQRPPFARATSVQKCIRTQDIEEVGKTTRHGTFFQMNGNFSFGDYFKHGAIDLAWALSTNPVEAGGFGLDPERIWVTVYLDDDEAMDAWHDTIGVPLDRIVRRGKKDNYWQMGVPGPGGPCSELYYDRGSDYGLEGGPEVDEDRYMEFWNLVFMQDDLSAVRSKEDFDIAGPLPAKNIDTGMGMERMATLLQNVDNLYEIDETRPVLARAAELTGKVYGAHSGHAASESHPDDVRLRVIADHVRTALMLIGDGVTPANEGRGYVLRRILRRAVRSMRLLGYGDPSLPELLPVARDCMSPSYPELATDFERISTYAYAEEEAFRATLRAGTTIFDVAVDDAKRTTSATTPVLSGDLAFRLHDTHGFPIDLTLEMAAEQGVQVDEAGFRRLMAEQRSRAKADAQAKKTGHGDLSAFRSALDLGGSEFTGYREISREARVTAIIGDDGLLPAAGVGDEVLVVLDATPFYAEGGGQQPDTGRIAVSAAGREGELEVIDVQSPLPGLIAHRVRVVSGEVRPGDDALAQVDIGRRRAISRSHSATHLLHTSLRRNLGETAAQAGSLNAPGRLRFDFNTPGAVPASVLVDIEDEINDVLLRDLEVRWFVTNQEEARRLGAIAMFGEKYGDSVRVVEIGDYSRELCGGTHVDRSAMIGMVKLLGESSIGSGVRRVEALVGLDAFRYLAREHVLVHQLAGEFKSPPEELPERINGILERLRLAEKELDRLRGAAVLATAGDFVAGAQQIRDVRAVLGEAPAGVSGGDLRALALDVRGRLGAAGPVVVILASPTADGGVSFVAAVNEPGQAAGIAAGSLVGVFAPALGARGGGKADLAQGAGGDAAKLADAFAAVAAALTER